METLVQHAKQAMTKLKTVTPAISTTTLPSKALLHVLSVLLSNTVFIVLTKIRVQIVTLDMQLLHAAVVKAVFMTQI